MTPGKVDLTAYRGDTFAQTFRFLVGTVAEDLTGTTFLAQIRMRADATDVLAAFDVTTPVPTTGEVTISLTAVETASLPRTAVWDLQGTNGTDVLTRIYGQITVTEDVTR